MRFCTKCGGEIDDAAVFCPSCGQQAAGVQHGSAGAPGAGASGAGAIPVAARPSGHRPRSRAPLVLLTLAALVLIAGVVGWSIFLKPMSPAEYEDAVVDQLYELRDGVLRVVEGVDSLNSLGGASLDPDGHARFVEDTEEGLEMMRAATTDLRALRPPAEYGDAHRRMESFAAFFEDAFIPAIEEMQGDISPGMEEDRIWEVIRAPAERINTRHERAVQDLERASAQISIPQELLESFD